MKSNQPMTDEELAAAIEQMAAAIKHVHIALQKAMDIWSSLNMEQERRYVAKQNKLSEPNPKSLALSPSKVN